MVTQNNTGSWRVYLTGVISGLFFFALCGAVLAQQNRGAIVQTSPVEKMTSPNFSVIGGSVVAGNPIAINASLSAKIELNNLRSVEFLNYQIKSSKDRNLYIQIG